MNPLSFEALYHKVKSNPDIHITAAGPAKHDVLITTKRILAEELAEVTFVGDAAWVFKTAEHADVDMTKVKIIHETDLRFPAAALTVSRATEGTADILINGYVKSEYMLQAALDPTLNFTLNGVLSELTAVELSDLSKMVFVADTGIHAHPSLEEKGHILESSLVYLKRLGMENTKVAMLGGTILKMVPEDEAVKKDREAEKVALLERVKDKYPDVSLSFPVTLQQALEEKPDLFLCSGAIAGQVLTQAMLAFVGGKTGSIIVGGAAPMVLIPENPDIDHIWRSVLLAMAGV